MKVILKNKFATAEDTAAVLGVSKTRLKRLMRLFGPKMFVASAQKSSVSSGKNGPRANRKKAGKVK